MKFDEKTKAFIKKTYAKNATNDEFEEFIHIAQLLGLDPALKEIYFIKYNNSNKSKMIVTARDGYLKIAHRSGEWDGMMSATVRENDVFEINTVDNSVIHKFRGSKAKRGEIIGAWAKVNRKNCQPLIQFVDFDEYNKKKNMWLQFPSSMIEKVAQSRALRFQFSINILSIEELSYNSVDEMKNDYTTPVKEEFKDIGISQPKPKKIINPRQKIKVTKAKKEEIIKNQDVNPNSFEYIKKKWVEAKEKGYTGKASEFKREYLDKDIEYKN